MLAICIECSHQRGMGHLFRALNLIHYLDEAGMEWLLLVNEDQAAERILRERDIPYLTVDLWDMQSDWERTIIENYQVTVWLNDRLDTAGATAQHVKETGIPLYTIDDMGEGAVLADGNFASLVFEDIDLIPGRKVYAGPDYLILNPEIRTYRRQRTDLHKILVTLGGSDTYGVTTAVIESLKRLLQSTGTDEESGSGAETEHRHARGPRHPEVTVLLGPAAVNRSEVEAALAGTGFGLISSVPSLIQSFAEYDLAITGGGVTCLEAAASGLPCVIIANELHEIPIGSYVERIGGGMFAGYYQEMNLDCIKPLLNEKQSGMEQERIWNMSRNGMERVSLEGASRICRVIQGEAK